MAEGNIWDQLSNIVEKGVTGYFDMKTADSQENAAKALQQAEQAKASYIDQLSRSFALSGSGQQIAAMGTWLLPIAVLGVGGVLISKFLKK